MSDTTRQHEPCEVVPIPAPASSEAWLRTHLEVLDAEVANHVRSLLQTVEQLRTRTRFQPLSAGRPAEGERCIVVNTRGRPTFGQVIHGRIAPIPDSLNHEYFTNVWDDLTHYFVIPPIK